MTEFLHEVVAKRGAEDFWNSIEIVRPPRAVDEAAERLLQWLIEQQREEENVDNQSN